MECNLGWNIGRRQKKFEIPGSRSTLGVQCGLTGIEFFHKSIFLESKMQSKTRTTLLSEIINENATQLKHEILYATVQ